jgi:hypothetical protein
MNLIIRCAQCHTITEIRENGKVKMSFGLRDKNGLDFCDKSCQYDYYRQLEAVF